MQIPLRRSPKSFVMGVDASGSFTFIMAQVDTYCMVDWLI